MGRWSRKASHDSVEARIPAKLPAELKRNAWSAKRHRPPPDEQRVAAVQGEDGAIGAVGEDESRDRRWENAAPASNVPGMSIRIPCGRLALGIVVCALAVAGRAAAQAPAVPFPDVPPWHWAYQGLASDARAGLFVGYPASPADLVANSLTQVFDGFAHARTPEARAWVERFTYNRPASWPQPFERSTVARFSLGGVASTIAGDATTATFRATITTVAGRTTVTPMRAGLRLIDGDWKVDYATLAEGSTLFR